MSAGIARIPAARLERTRQQLDFLCGDLKNVRLHLEAGLPIAVTLLDACERQMLRVLDEISPEIRRAIAEEQRYLAAAKVGAS